MGGGEDRSARKRSRSPTERKSNKERDETEDRSARKRSRSPTERKSNKERDETKGERQSRSDRNTGKSLSEALIFASTT